MTVKRATDRKGKDFSEFIRDVSVIVSLTPCL